MKKATKKAVATATLAVFATSGMGVMATPVFAADATHLTDAKKAELSNNGWIQAQKDKEAQMQKNLQAGNYSISDPYVEVNPYGRNYLCAMVMFKTAEPAKITAVVNVPEEFSGENDDLCTFTFQFDEYATEHYIPVSGLFNGDNVVTLKAVTKSGEETSADVAITAKMPAFIEVKTEVVTQNPTVDQASGVYVNPEMKDEITPGINFLTYTTIGGFDMNGKIRAYFTDDTNNTATPVRATADGHIEYIAGHTRGGYYCGWFMEMDIMGKLYKQYLMTGLHHEWRYLENGNILADVELPNGETTEDYFIEIDAKTGEILRDMYLKDSYSLNEYSAAGNLYPIAPTEDWMHVNSFAQVPGEDAVVVSGRNQATLFKLNMNNEVVWVSTEPFDGLTKEMNKKLLTPVVTVDGKTMTVEDWWLNHPSNTAKAPIDWSNPYDPYYLAPDHPFEYTYGQHAVNIMPGTPDNAKEYDMYAFDNGNSRSKNKANDVKKEDQENRGVIYHVNEVAGTIEQTWEYRDRFNDGKKLFSAYMCDMDVLGENHYMITYSAEGNTVNPRGGLAVEVKYDPASKENIVMSRFEYAGRMAYRGERIDLPTITNQMSAGKEYAGNFKVVGRQIGELQQERTLLATVSLDQSEINLQKGANKPLVASMDVNFSDLYMDEYGMPELTVAYSSSNKNVATVNEYGMVTAVGAGSATITAKVVGAYNSGSTNDMYYNDEATCKVTVSEGSAEVVAPEKGEVLLQMNIGSMDYTAKGETKAMDVAPYIDSASRTMVPVRFVSQALGAKVDYNKATRSVTITKGSDVIKLRIGSRNYTVNGAVRVMDTAAVIESDRTMVPARFVMEALGYQVDYADGQISVR